MEQYTKQEELGMCEAYSFYKLLSDDDKNKVPEWFVKNMKECSQKHDFVDYNDMYEICKATVSKEGAKRIAFIYLCLNSANE